MRAGSQPTLRIRPTSNVSPAESRAQLGEIDILVNNAGATWGAPAEDHPLDAWDKVMNLNVRGIFLLTQAVGRASMIPRRTRTHHQRRIDRGPCQATLRER